MVTNIIQQYFPTTGNAAVNNTLPASESSKLHIPRLLHQEARKNIQRFRTLFKHSFNNEKLEVRDTINMGIGVFTKKEFSDGEKIAIYTKKLLPLEEAEKDNNNFSYAYVDKTGLIAVATNHVIEFARFINDLLSDTRNKIKLKWIKSVLYAITHDAIAPGEQLGLAYGPEYWIEHMNNTTPCTSLRSAVLKYYPSIIFNSLAPAPFSMRTIKPVDLILSASDEATVARHTSEHKIPHAAAAVLSVPVPHLFNTFSVLDSSSDEECPEQIFEPESDDESTGADHTFTEPSHSGRNMSPPTNMSSMERVKCQRANNVLRIHGVRIDRKPYSRTTSPINDNQKSNRLRSRFSSPNTGPKSNAIKKLLSELQSNPSLLPSISTPTDLPTQEETAHAAILQQLCEANLCDWKDLLVPGTTFYSLIHNEYIMIDSELNSDFDIANLNIFEAFEAVKVNVPKSFVAALQDPIWKEAALKEWNMLIRTKCLVQTPKHLANQDIQNKAQIFHPIPVYEKKADELVVYLVWNAKSPRNIYQWLCESMRPYLHRTTYLPLVHGGNPEISIVSYCDASLGSGPYSRSIVGAFTKLLAYNAKRNTLSQFFALVDATTFNNIIKVPDTVSIFPFIQNKAQIMHPIPVYEMSSFMGLVLIDAPNHLNQQFYSDILTSDIPDDPMKYPFDLLNTSG